MRQLINKEKRLTRNLKAGEHICLSPKDLVYLNKDNSEHFDGILIGNIGENNCEVIQIK